MIESQQQKVKNYVLSRIESGIWLPNKKIASEFELVKLLKVSRSTVNRALKELTTKGYLIRIQGMGSFVSDKKLRYTLLEIKSIADEIAETGGNYTCSIIDLQIKKADPFISSQLETKEGSDIFYSKIVHYNSGSPLQLAERYINPCFAPDYLKQDFTKISPSDYLFSLGELTEVEHTIQAIAADSTMKTILNLNDNEPCLIIHRRTWSNDIIANYARLIHPASKFKPCGRFSPKVGSSVIMA